jgi:heat shock protein HslJ
MKSKLSIIFSLFISICSFCQTSVEEKSQLQGTWQEVNSEVSSNYHDTYTFFQNNKFEFTPTGYNGLNRIIKISGTYKIEENQIKFNVQKITELVGGKIERSRITTLSNSWAIDGGKLVTKKVNEIEQIATFNFCKTKDANPNCFEIDNNRYFKVNE